jgi:hypothetical protein
MRRKVRRPAPPMVDLAGSWAMANDEELLIRVDPGPELENYTGFPLNAAGRQKALTWNSTIQAGPRAPGASAPGAVLDARPGPNFHMGEVIDAKSRQLVAYTITGLFENANRTIWLDGRPHPSEFAEHLWNGFSTGVWEKGMLKVTTTHMKQAFLQRNGIPSSPYGVMTEYFIRHGDRLLVISQVDDPIYLEEPMVRTSTFKWNPVSAKRRSCRWKWPRSCPTSSPATCRTIRSVPADRLRRLERAAVGRRARRRETIYPEYARRCSDDARADRQLAAAGRAARHEPRRPTYAATGSIEVLPIQGSVYLLAGGGSNVVVQVGDDAVFVVDANAAAHERQDAGGDPHDLEGARSATS